MVISIAAIEQATGLDREVLRKWERRYGFPLPVRDAHGGRQYPEDQVLALCLIRKLMDAGFRPAKVVGLDLQELQSLAETLTPRAEARETSFESEALAIVRRRDVEGLTAFFQRYISTHGNLAFIRDKLSTLNVAIGDAWFRGDLAIFEEHLYTEVVQEVLGRAMTVMAPANDPPRVLLTTPSGELHTLGLTMTKLFFRHAGVYCVALGAQTPVNEICDAAEQLDIAIVCLSVSLALPTRVTTAFLRELGQRLRPQTKIWVGGMGVTRLSRSLPRVVRIPTFGDAQRELDTMRGFAMSTT